MPKRPTPLFEVLKQDQKDATKSGAPGMLARMRQRFSTGQLRHLSTVAKAPAGDSDVPSAASGGGPVWVIQAGVGHALAAFAVLLAALLIGYIWGRSALPEQGVVAGGPGELASLRVGPPQPEVLELEARGSQADSGSGESGTGRLSEAAIPAAPVASGGFRRQVGLNYLIIQSFTNLDAARHAAAFIKSKGVRCSIERLDQRYYSLVSAVGFDYSDSRQEKNAEAFKAQIRSLGQMYLRAYPQMRVDFHDCYYKKWLRD